MKKTAGLTLIEMVIALGLWLVLMSGILFVWQYTAMSGANLFERQNAFENARITMDALLMNLQLAWEIDLKTDSEDNLDSLALWQLDPQDRAYEYLFTFHADRGEFRIGGNALASGIAEIKMARVDETRMTVMVVAACDEPIVLWGCVDVRYKDMEWGFGGF
ncbi:MAG: type II secretion system GspH family protein [Defluviitaleaceae bacterium]|nr:type II secretion system GspH family protein [Defluviitaleaceae bacterium]